jgi:hypothetical protein
MERRRRLAGVVLVGLVPMVGWGIAAAAGRAADERVGLRAEAHTILGTFCGRCHDGKLATAKPKALAIFDLSRSDWADRLTDVRLDHMLGRMDSFGVPEPSRDRLRAFVDAEKRARR